MKKIEPRTFIKGKKISVCIRLPEELVKTLHKIASRRGHGFSSFVQEALDQWAKAHECNK